MSESSRTAKASNNPVSGPSIPPTPASGGAPAGLGLVRLAVDKPQAAAQFLRSRSHGVMDLIAHFWEGLGQTPPLQRADLHLVAAIPTNNKHINMSQLNEADFRGAMLYVPKAHRADVLALDQPSAAAFVAYIAHHAAGAVPAAPDASGTEGDSTPAKTHKNTGGAEQSPLSGSTIKLTDLSSGRIADSTKMPSEIPPGEGKAPIDFLTGQAEGIAWMVPQLLPLVGKRAPARHLVNVVMQLPELKGAAGTAGAGGGSNEQNAHVRLAKESDVPLLNRWRRLYKEERGILFDADMDAWIQNQRIFVYESEDPKGADPSGKQVVAVAKIDLDLQQVVEIGGVYTFPEFRNKGYGAGIVREVARRIAQGGKTPMLQVDEQNTPALRLYRAAGWRELGKLARVWLTG